LSSKVSLAPAAMHRSSALNSATPALTSAKLHIEKFNRKLRSATATFTSGKGRWFKKNSSLTVCGEGELIKTFLQPGQIATGKELN